MSRRNIKRIDYKELHSTGQIHHKSTEDLSFQLSNLTLDESTIMPQSDEVVIDIMVLIEDTKDMIDENPVHICTTTQELDSFITRLEQQRNAIRRKSHVLKPSDSSDDVLQMSIENMLSTIKDSIKEAKEYQGKLNLAQSKQSIIDASTFKERSVIFALEDMERNITQLETDFKQDLNKTSDVQLMQFKNDINSITKRFQKMSEKYESILQSPVTKADTLVMMKDMGERYVKLDSLKHNFVNAVNEEVSKRKLDKDLHYDKAHLNIKLDKFHGYESAVDYYTFKDNFEKVYLQSTPAKFLPDLLKNNFLAEPALTLVRSLNNIDQIWNGLKIAYGDTKVLLSKKLQTLSKSDLTKTRDPEKLVYAISSLANMLREVMSLAKQHKIESNLYYGDALQRIYQLLGDGRLTRFLSSTAEEELNEKQTWEKLLKFLEKEEKLQQQKTVISNLKHERKEVQPKSNRRFNNRESYYGSSDTPRCHICGESSGSSDHVATFGPNNSKIVQYFTCKTFIEKTPAGRLKILREKGLCYQCLLPGADVTQGKHLEGRY